MFGAAVGLALTPNRIYLDSQPPETTIQKNAMKDSIGRDFASTIAPVR